MDMVYCNAYMYDMLLVVFSSLVIFTSVLVYIQANKVSPSRFFAGQNRRFFVAVYLLICQIADMAVVTKRLSVFVLPGQEHLSIILILPISLIFYCGFGVITNVPSLRPAEGS